MKQSNSLLIIAFFLICSFSLPSCLSDDGSEQYAEWKNLNDEWIMDKETETDENGNLVYTKIVSPSNPQGYVLMKWHNDRSLTNKNLKPLSNSTVDIKYHGRIITEEAFDSSYNRTSPADSIYRSVLNKNIEGWVIGITNMHVGDSATILIPYYSAYGTAGTGSIKPFSNLIFDVKLVGIPGYEIPVNND